MTEKNEVKVWGVHTKNEALFLRDGVIAIGWDEMGDLSTLPDDREAFKALYLKTYPDKNKQSAATNGGMIYRFLWEMTAGDYVVFYSRSDRKVNIGTVEGGYEYAPEQKDYPNQRKVKWLKHIDRTAFSQGSMYELGAAMTIFTVKNYADEFIGALDGSFKPYTSESEEDDESVLVYTEAIEDNTKDFILRELSMNLKGYPMEEFVKALLDAMGYRAEVSPMGGDRGIDLIAYKDELPPRILVQVKSRDGQVRESTIQSLRGAMREGDYGLFITLSSFTANAEKYLAETPIIRGIDGPRLAELVVQYYEKIDKKWQRFIPLKQVYIPDISEETLE